MGVARRQMKRLAREKVMTLPLERRFWPAFGAICLLWVSTAVAIQPVESNDVETGSLATDLDQAVNDLAAGRLDQATAHFERLCSDRGQAAFVRALARFGLAEAAWMRNDRESALAAWREIVSDAGLPRSYREKARERLRAAKRRPEGRPEYDPLAHRASLPPIPAAAVQFHVATGGDDVAGDGSMAHPFRSLRAARDAVRAWRKSPEGARSVGSVQVIIHPGHYASSETLHLTESDSGTAASPVIYRAATMSRAIFEGGIRITNWKPIADSTLRKRLASQVQQRVLQADITDLGITNFGDATALRRCPELFCNGLPQTLARWPDTGFVKTGRLLGSDTFKVWNSIPGCRDGKFCFVEDRPLNWLDEPDVRLYGYWFWDWLEEFQRVASIDTETHSFTLTPPYSRYGYRQDQRYFALNVLRELDRPGEWYLDRRSGIIYWLPPTETDVATAEVTLSVFNGPFITLDDTQHIVLLGLTFQEGRGDGIHMRGGAHNLIAACSCRRLGGDAVVIDGGHHHGLFGCAFYSLGCGGARVTGGNRSTLARGEHFMENCTVNDISRLKRTYTPAVRLDGCGNRVAHNLFTRIPSSAMRIEGNEQLIELNVIRHVVQESDDQGGLDMFGNPLYRGVVIRWNQWSDIGGGTHCGAAGVRLDDMISGVSVHGNIFRRCGAVIFGGVQIHGGKGNMIDGNVFLDCFAGVSFSRWGEQRWLKSIERFEERANQPPFSTRYPELAQLKSGADINFVCRNVFSGCGSTLLRDGGLQQTALNVVTDAAIDVDWLSDRGRMREHPSLREAMIEPIPSDDMGLYPHPWQVVPE
jgi:hypothetical protein